MKTNKWTKWKAGAVGAVGIALLFQQVKGSDAFAQAHDKVVAESNAAKAQSGDEFAMGGGGSEPAAPAPNVDRSQRGEMAPLTADDGTRPQYGRGRGRGRGGDFGAAQPGGQAQQPDNGGSGSTPGSGTVPQYGGGAQSGGSGSGSGSLGSGGTSSQQQMPSRSHTRSGRS